jgi:multiple sugar transport system ATP-binding protein
MAEVGLEHVSKVFPNGVQAVRDLTLRVSDGELVVLVGPSGCGKTTTLRLIAGLETPTEGGISIGGRGVNRLPPRDRDVALVSQSPALYPHMSVRRNLAFGLEMRRPGNWLNRRLWRRREARGWDGEIAERVGRAARLLELEDVLDRLPSQLSGGQQQRVALGRAIVRQPAAFLLDEPLSHLETRLRLEMRRELHLLHRRLQATMIYVTHDPVEALSLGDRVAVLDRGVLQQEGPPLEVYDRPRNRLVAGFLGWPPMSFLDGRLARREGRPWFTGPGGALPVPAACAAGADEAGSEVTLGVRPEDVRVGAADGDARLEMEIALAEPLGTATLLTLRRAGWQVTATVGRESNVAEGEKVEVRFDMARTHWFDRASGLALDGCRPSG